MGYRFYTQQLEATGNCPGAPLTNRRKRKMALTDESRQQAIEAYEAAGPTPENSMEIVKQIAEDMGESPNGVRMILTKAEVYVKKAPAEGKSSSSSGNGGGTRVNKESAQQALIAALTDAGGEIDEDIISKLTGKAAVYFTTEINKILDK